MDRLESMECSSAPDLKKNKAVFSYINSTDLSSGTIESVYLGHRRGARELVTA
jgi:hypothetical protein